MVEERAMSLEEAVAQPVIERLAAGARLSEQLSLLGGGPLRAVGGGEKSAQALGGRLLSSDRREADDAVGVERGTIVMGDSGGTTIKSWGTTIKL
jgi:hypothetical protein